MNFLIRADASAEIGTGHVMRCLTLADELRDRNVNIEFICDDSPGNLIGYIHDKRNYRVHSVHHKEISDRSPEVDGKTDFGNWSKEICEYDATSVTAISREKKLAGETVDWIIADHYSIDEKWESEVKKNIPKVMIIDDLANRKHNCDLLLDQNYTTDGTKYNGLIPRSAIPLIGTEYALLRREFRDIRRKLNRQEKPLSMKVFVFFGGSDPTNQTEKALLSIKMLERNDIKTEVIVGASNPNYEKVRTICETMTNVDYYSHMENIAEKMSEATIAIGAGGATAWERCCLGLPSITVILAENQRKITSDLAEKGYIISAGWWENVSIDGLSKLTGNLLRDLDLQNKLSRRSFELVDGFGAERVAKRILN